MSTTINVDPSNVTAADMVHTIDPVTRAPITMPIVTGGAAKPANTGTNNADPTLKTDAVVTRTIDPVTRAPVTTVSG